MKPWPGPTVEPGPEEPWATVVLALRALGWRAPLRAPRRAVLAVFTCLVAEVACGAGWIARWSADELVEPGATFWGTIGAFAVLRGMGLLLFASALLGRWPTPARLVGVAWAELVLGAAPGAFGVAAIRGDDPTFFAVPIVAGALIALAPMGITYWVPAARWFRYATDVLAVAVLARVVHQPRESSDFVLSVFPVGLAGILRVASVVLVREREWALAALVILAAVVVDLLGAWLSVALGWRERPGG